MARHFRRGSVLHAGLEGGSSFCVWSSWVLPSLRPLKQASFSLPPNSGGYETALLLFSETTGINGMINTPQPGMAQRLPGKRVITPKGLAVMSVLGVEPMSMELPEMPLACGVGLSQQRKPSEYEKIPVISSRLPACPAHISHIPGAPGQVVWRDKAGTYEGMEAYPLVQENPICGYSFQWTQSSPWLPPSHAVLLRCRVQFLLGILGTASTAYASRQAPGDTSNSSNADATADRPALHTPASNLYLL